MSARVKQHKVRGRQLEEVREKDPTAGSWFTTHGRHTGKDAALWNDLAGDARCRQGLPGGVHRGQPGPLRACDPGVPGSGREPDLNERQLHARRRVHKVLEALGGISSPAGSCVWHVVAAAKRPRMGDSVRLGWAVRAIGPSAGDFGGGTGCVGHAPRAGKAKRDLEDYSLCARVVGRPFVDQSGTGRRFLPWCPGQAVGL
jgi:hypothetical protein